MTMRYVPDGYRYCLLLLVVPAQAGTHNTVTLVTPYGLSPARERHNGKQHVVAK